MDEEAARVILSWRYPPPYDFYDILANEEEGVSELLNGAHFVVQDDRDNIVGFFAFGSGAQVPGGTVAGLYRDTMVLDVGLGLKPELTGRGLGLPFVQAGVEFARQRFAPPRLRLSVATFNERAITVYRRAGFHPVTTFRSATDKQEAEFLLMETDDFPSTKDESRP